MRKAVVLLIIFFEVICQSFAQRRFPTNPDSALFRTTDINNFWKAFEDFKKDSTINTFGTNYIDRGSEGVKGFIANRIQSSENLFATVKRRRADYEKVKENTLQIKRREKQCRSTFYALKYWYPAAQFPPVYFVIGAFNSGGTFNRNGLFIGAEMQTDINNIPYIVAHELIHFQQTNKPENATLLQQSIIEGSADFLGELISGDNTIKPAYDYGNRDEQRLYKEFLSRMDSTNYTDWLYGVSGKDSRPNDLGYWIGYKITDQYFRNASDKRRAIREILNIKDYKDFLKKSKYKGESENPTQQ